MNTMEDSKDLKVLFPDEDLVINGEQITIKPFSFGKIPKVISQASAMIQMVLTLPEDLITADGNIDLENPATAIILASMLEQCSSQVFTVLSLASDKPVSWVENLPPDEGLLLLVKVWEINKDFFTRRLGPMLQGLNIKIKPPKIMIPSNGEQLSVN